MKKMKDNLSAMKNGGKNIDPKQILDDLSNSLLEMRLETKPEELSKADRQELIEGYNQLEIQAWKCKLSLRLRLLLDEKPTVSHRAALSEILTGIPDELAPAALAELASYTISEWGKLKGELAASL